MSYTIKKDDIDQYYRKEEYFAKEYPTERRMKNAINKRFKQYEDIINTPLVKKIDVEMEWVRNSTWGMNPHATAKITYVDGTTKRVGGYKASGTGYSKSMHLLEQILNDNALQNLFAFFENGQENSDSLRGVHLPNNNTSFPYYGLGAEEGKFANFDIDHYVNGKTFDAYEITFRNPNGTMLGKKIKASKKYNSKLSYLQDSVRNMF